MREVSYLFPYDKWNPGGKDFFNHAVNNQTEAEMRIHFDHKFLCKTGINTLGGFSSVLEANVFDKIREQNG